MNVRRGALLRHASLDETQRRSAAEAETHMLEALVAAGLQFAPEHPDAARAEAVLQSEPPEDR